MTQRNKEAVDGALAELDDLVRCRCIPAFKDRGMRDPDCDCDSADAVAIVRAALDAAEARERAAVAAAYEKAADRAWKDSGPTLSRAIRALSDTDALAEYVEKVRAEERERCLQLVEEYRQRAEARAEVTRGVGKHDATKGHEGQAAAAVSIAAAIRQETNDG
jgi:hypothetical protein